jgi:GT2 family glycosyltransferase
VPPSDSLPEPNEPRVSVVLATQNSKDSLTGCLDSLSATGAGSNDLEIVSVDLGSRDGSDSLDAAYPWLVMMRLPRNFGLTRGRNVGIRVAKGEYVVIMDPRVRVEPATLSTMVSALDGRADAAAAICQIIDDKGESLPQSFPLPVRSVLAEACRQNQDPPAAIPSGEFVEAARPWLIMVRRRFIAGMNFLDEKRYWNSWSEVDMFRQVRSSGKKTLFVPGVRAVLSGDERRPSTPAGRALAAADRAAGACSYLAKEEGFMAGLVLKVSLLLSSFGQVLTFREPGYHLRLFANLLGGVAVDGTQGGELS